MANKPTPPKGGVLSGSNKSEMGSVSRVASGGVDSGSGVRGPKKK